MTATSQVGDTGNVNTVLVELVRGRDGRLYPAHPATHAERNRARWLSHNLIHRDHLSVRLAQKIMRERYGMRRSVGSIMRDLRLWECPRCPHMPGLPPSDDRQVQAQP
jgi:hypothetical protein